MNMHFEKHTLKSILLHTITLGRDFLYCIEWEISQNQWRQMMMIMTFHDKKCEHAHPSWWYISISIEYLCRFSFEFSCTEKFIGLLKFFQNEDKIWKIKIKIKKFVCCALETSSTERFSHNHVQLCISFTFYLKYIPNGLVRPFCLHFTRITRKKTKKNSDFSKMGTNWTFKTKSKTNAHF